MGIPTTAEFAEWLALASTTGESIYYEMLPPFDDEPIPRELVIEFFQRLDAHGYEAFERMRAMRVYEWLDSNREFWAARDMVHKRAAKPLAISKPSASDYAASADALIEHAARSAEGTTRTANYWLRSRLRSTAFNDQAVLGPWVHSTVVALAEYFDEGSAERLMRDQREAEEICRGLNPLLGRLATLNQQPRFHAGSVRILPRQHFMAVGRFAEMGGSLTVVAPAAFLFRRAVKTADERLFVYRMFGVNSRQARNPKVSAIAALMSMKGFRHRYEERTISRICEEITDAKKAARAALAS